MPTAQCHVSTFTTSHGMALGPKHPPRSPRPPLSFGLALVLRVSRVARSSGMWPRGLPTGSPCRPSSSPAQPLGSLLHLLRVFPKCDLSEAFPPNPRVCAHTPSSPPCPSSRPCRSNVLWIKHLRFALPVSRLLPTGTHTPRGRAICVRFVDWHLVGVQRNECLLRDGTSV